jgi:hypothetical protein
VSIRWTTEQAGSDGDFAYGRLAVNLWQDREGFVIELEHELALAREGMLAEHEANLAHASAED